jgi:hypothetical protein
VICSGKYDFDLAQYEKQQSKTKNDLLYLKLKAD